MSEAYEVGRSIYLPNRYVICYHIRLNPEAFEEVGALQSVLEAFTRRKISIVHIKLSRLRPRRPVEASVFVDVTDKKNSINDIERDLRKLRFTKEITVINPLPSGIILDNTLFPLSFMGERAIICTESFFKALLKDMREYLGTAHAVWLYHVGVNTGCNLYEKILKIVNKERIDEIVHLAQGLLQHVGFGIIRITYDVSRCQASIDVKDSFECKLFSNSQQPESHYLRGMLAGFLSKVFKREVKVEEHKCIAMGDEYCEFKANPLT